MRNINIFKGRLNIRNYILGSLVMGFIFNFDFWWKNINVYIAIVLLIIALIFTFSILVRRAHDIGWGGKWILLMFVPIANAILGVFLLFKSGQTGSNIYGDQPQPKFSIKSILGITDTNNNKPQVQTPIPLS